MSADEDLANTPRTRPEVRLSHAEREAYVERLKTAQDEGRITLDEFEERVGRVYAAKVGSEMCIRDSATTVRRYRGIALQ